MKRTIVVLLIGLVFLGCREEKKSGGRAGIIENLDHFACRVDDDCGLAFVSCCGAIAVDKDFLKQYQKPYDTSQCAAVECMRLVAVCKNNNCVAKSE